MFKNEKLVQEAKKIFVGGVNSPVRAFKGVGEDPIFMASAKGPYLFSEEGKQYIDYVLSWGPHLFGHNPDFVVKAVEEGLKYGMSFGAPSVLETELATLIQYFFPSMEKIRFVNSGTEAGMSVIRLARGFTKRKLIVKFNGCYHGHADSLLVSAGSGGLTFSTPDSEGVLEDVAKHTVVLDYNDVDAIRSLFSSRGKEIAGVILEAVCGNMGVVLPSEAFLEAIVHSCNTYGSVLIFDEVMTGFRIRPGGAQSFFGINPDLTMLGKVVGGGLPCAAFGGKAEIMNHLSPEGGVYQAGTLSGNPLAMRAGIAMLNSLKTEPLFDKALSQTKALCEGMKGILSKKGLAYTVVSEGTLFSLYFTQGPIRCLSDVKRSDIASFKRYYHKMLAGGIYFAPSQFEANFMSSVHQDEDIQTTLAVFEKEIG